MREKRKIFVALEPFMTEAAQMLYICPSPDILFGKQREISDSPVTKGILSLPRGFPLPGSVVLPSLLDTYKGMDQ